MRYRNTLKKLDSDLQLIEEKYSKRNQGMRSVKHGADKNPSITKMDFLPSKVLKKIAKEKDVNEEEISEGMFDNIFKRSKVNNSSSKQSAREQLAKLKSGEMSIDDVVGTQQKSRIDAMYDDTESMLRDLGYEEKKETPEETIERLRKEIERRKIKRIRENIKETDLNEKKKRKKKPGNPNYYKGTRKSNKSMEREINKCAKKPRPKSCYDYWDADKKYDKASKNESLEELQFLVSEIIENELEERKKRKKRKSSKLSAKTRETLKKKAKNANMPLGALTGVYRKGLAAWLTGHRQGVPQHAWAMARVNSFIRGGKTRSVDKSEWRKVQNFRKKK